MTSGLTADETALYDRQIRIWGVEGQKQIQSSRFLVAGLRGLSAEICKNVALAGVGEIVLLDDELVSQHDLAANFMVRPTDVGSKVCAVCDCDDYGHLSSMPCCAENFCMLIIHS